MSSNRRKVEVYLVLRRDPKWGAWAKVVKKSNHRPRLERGQCDLTDDDRRGLRYLEQLLADRGCKCGACGAAPAKSVLDKLIGGKS